MFTLYNITLLLFFCSFFLCYILTPLTRRFALKFNVVDFPGDRKIHHEIIPRSGGIAIFLSFFITLILLYLIVSHQYLSYGKLFVFSFIQIKLFWLKTALYLIGAWIIILIGILDDIKSIDFKIKLLGQCLAAAIIIWGAQGKLNIFSLNPLDTVISFLWIVGLTNSFNLLDNMNGLSAGLASILILFFLMISLLAKHFLLSLFLIIPLGSYMGFLPHNFPKAKVFLGDTGSLFIGFSSATYSIWLFEHLVHSQASWNIIWGFSLLLIIPLFDTFSVIFIRLKNKKPIYIGDTNHLSHQLVRLGLSTTHAVLILFASSFVCCLFGLLYIFK